MPGNLDDLFAKVDRRTERDSAVAAQVADQAKEINQEDRRRRMVYGLKDIEAINFLRFDSIPSRANPYQRTLLFDSFAIQRITRQSQEIISVNYTNGQPLVDVFHHVPETLSIAGVIPDMRAVSARGESGQYVLESLEALRSFYDRFFRANATAGMAGDYRGKVSLHSKNRVDIGALLRMTFTRSSDWIRDAQFTMEMLVHRSFVHDITKPVALVSPREVA